jgi:hypothetical protein
VDPFAGPEDERPGLLLELVAEHEVPMRPAVEALQVFLADEGTVLAREDVDGLLPPDLEQEVQLRVDVERRHRAGGRHEHERLAQVDPPGQRVADALDLAEAGVEQVGVGRVALDVLQHEPRPALGDAPDRLLGRQAVARRSGRIDAHGQVAGVVLHAVLGERLRQLEQARHREERVVREPVADRERLLPEERVERGTVQVEERLPRDRGGGWRLEGIHGVTVSVVLIL